MQINKIKAMNIEMTDAIRSYAQEKFLSLAPFTVNWEPVANCDIEIGKETEHHNKGPFFLCEVNMQIPGEMIRIEAREEDLYAAIDKAKDELKEKLVAVKEKMIDRHRESVEPEEGEEEDIEEGV